MSYIYSWFDILRISFQEVGFGVISFIPNLIGAIIAILGGWLVAVILGRLVSQVIRTIKIDTGLKAAGFDKVVEKSGFTLNSAGFIGALVKWFFIVVALITALDILNLKVVSAYLGSIVLNYLPNVIVAALILLVSVVISQAIMKLIVSTAKAAGLTSANVLGQIARWAVLVFAFMAALDQLQILSAFIQPLFIGVIAALSIALGLSFGLGGRDAAARYIEKVRSEMHHE